MKENPPKSCCRNDVRYLLPDQFIAVISELLLCLKVEQDDLPGLIHSHHRIRSCLQQGPVLRSRLFAFAQIVAELGKSSQVSGCVAQCSEGDICEKSRAVFAQTHALFFVPAALGGDAEYLFGPAPFNIFRRTDAGKVVTDNLIGSVPFNKLSPGIPTDNPALRIHHKNGVALDSVEEHPVIFFALSERVLLGRKVTALALYLRGVKHDLLTLIDSEMNECRQSEEAGNEEAAVYCSRQWVHKRDPIEPPELRCDGQEDGRRRRTPEQPLGALHGA